MKNKIGIIGGFVFGVMAAFLLIVVISKIHPEEDLAGILIFTCLLSGLFFASVGYLINNYYVRIKNKRLTQ